MKTTREINSSRYLYDTNTIAKIVEFTTQKVSDIIRPRIIAHAYNDYVDPFLIVWDEAKEEVAIHIPDQPTIPFSNTWGAVYYRWGYYTEFTLKKKGVLWKTMLKTSDYSMGLGGDGKTTITFDGPSKRDNEFFASIIGDAAVVTTFRRDLVNPTHDDFAWKSSPMRLVAGINTILSWFALAGVKKIDTAEGNALLKDIRVYRESITSAVYVVDNEMPSEVYSREDKGVDPFGSCMSGKNRSYFEIYDSLKHRGNLKILTFYHPVRVGWGDERSSMGLTPEERGRHIGRCLLWDLDGVKYIDRVYSTQGGGDIDPAVLAALQEYCKEHDITKRVCEKQGGQLDSFLQFSSRVAFYWGTHPRHYDRVPYIDSFRWYHADGKFRNRDTDDAIATFNCTDGSYEGSGGEDDEDEDEDEWEGTEEEDPMVVPFGHIEYFPASACTYFTYGNSLRCGGGFRCDNPGWYLNEDLRPLDSHHYGTARVPDECVVEAYDGLYILKEHAVLCIDDKWCHTGEASPLSSVLYGPEAYAHPRQMCFNRFVAGSDTTERVLASDIPPCAGTASDVAYCDEGGVLHPIADFVQLGDGSWIRRDTETPTLPGISDGPTPPTPDLTDLI